MDKETLSNYGWIVIACLVLCVMIALASPFGHFIENGVKSTTQGLFDVNQSALNSTGLITMEDQTFPCAHNFENYKCTQCGVIEEHTCNYENSICAICGKSENHICIYDSNGLCTLCGEAKPVDYKFTASDYDEKMGTTTETDTNVVIPEAFECDGVKYKVTSLGRSAFHGCTSVTSIVIPDSVTSIGSYAFYQCTSLTSIRVPDNITTIGTAIFSGCTALKSITIPNGVTSIGSNAFLNCSVMTSITIPADVVSIGNSAFSGCGALTTVNYRGSAEQWATITMDGGNDFLKNATINYNYSGE